MRSIWCDNSMIIGPYLALVINEKQFHKAMNHCKIPFAQHGNWISNEHSDATMHTLEKPDGKMCCVVAIRVKEDQDKNEVIGLLVHEAVHVWQDFADRIGESNPSKEFEAYAIQSISQRLISAYSEMTASEPD